MNTSLDKMVIESVEVLEVIRYKNRTFCRISTIDGQLIRWDDMSLEKRPRG